MATQSTPEQLIIENFVRFLATTFHSGLIITGTENYSTLVEGNGVKLAIARARLPVLFKDGFNALDVAHLQQVRHRLDTAILQLKNLKEKGKGGKTIVLADAWDPKMKVESIKAAVDSVYSPGVPLEVGAFWCAETHANPLRFCDITPNRPRALGVPIKIVGAEGGHHDPAHEHGKAHEHDGEGQCCGG